MMTLSSALLVLLLVCSLPLIVVAKPTCQLQEHVVMSAHHSLRDLGGRFPVHCLPYNANVSFPGSAFPAATASRPQCRRALGVVYESLQEAGKIFYQHLSSDKLPVGEGGVTWDEEKLNVFLNLQDRVLEDGSCLQTACPGVLSSYFGNVTSLLQQQESAACGWMALRRDLLWVLKSALHKFPSCFS